MERCSVCETLVQTTTATAVGIHCRVAPCEKLFHASCTCNKLHVANDNVVHLETHSVAPDELVSLSSNSHTEPNEDRLSLTTTLYDSSIDDLLIDYVEIIEDLIFNLLEKISILPFLLKNKKTIIKIAIIF